MATALNYSFARLRHPQSGFTLVELMVTIGLVAILASLAVPSWTEMQARGRVRAAVNDINGSLVRAQRLAADLKSPVTLCASSDGINCTANNFQDGWIVRVGPAVNAAGQRVLEDVQPKPWVAITTNTPGGRFTFLPSGTPTSNFAGGRILVCPTDPNFLHLVRRMTISRGGSITLDSPNVCAFN